MSRNVFGAKKLESWIQLISHAGKNSRVEAWRFTDSVLSYAPVPCTESLKIEFKVDLPKAVEATV